MPIRSEFKYFGVSNTELARSVLKRTETILVDVFRGLYWVEAYFK
jgi:hypothetical protein